MSGPSASGLVPADAVVTSDGEIVPRSVFDQRMTPASAGEVAAWVRDMHMSVLVEGTDYGQIPGTGDRPTLLKPGAEMLLLAAGLGFNMIREDDENARQHRGVFYRCEVFPRGRPGDVFAVCEAYAGYDESRFVYRSGQRAPWNTVIKMAEKRALVGAALNATAASGLFVADADDTYTAPTNATQKLESQTGTAADTPPCNEDTAAAGATNPPPANGGAGAAVLARVDALGPDARRAFDAHRDQMNWPWPPTSGAVIRIADKYLDALEAPR